MQQKEDELRFRQHERAIENKTKKAEEDDLNCHFFQMLLSPLQRM